MPVTIDPDDPINGEDGGFDGLAGDVATSSRFWIGAANAALSAAHNLGALATGLVVNTAGTPSTVARGTNGHVLTMVAGIEAWAAPTGGVSDGDKGDIVVSSSGSVWTIDVNAVTTNKILDGSLSADANGRAKMADGYVTYAKLQDISATQRVVGRNTAGSGDAEEVTVSQLLDWVGSTRGSILYRGASGWAILAPGTSGHVLTSNGAGADPSYAAGGGGVTAGGAAANTRVAFWTSASAINGSANWLFDDSGDVTQTLGDTGGSKATTLHLKSGTDLDLKILFDENGMSNRPWYLGVDASDSHKMVLGHNSTTLGSGTVSLKFQRTSGDVEALTDWNFTKSGTQNFTKEGTGNLQFRTAATLQEISFRPKLVETLTLTDDGSVGICKILPGGATHKLSFFNHAAAVQEDVGGSKGGNVALGNLLTALENYGLIVDSTT